MSGLPANWSKVTLGDVITGFEAGRNLRASSSPASASEFGVLKISAVSWGRFQPQENKALLPGDRPMPRELVRKGDLLISRANTTELVGAPVLVDRDYDNLMLPDKILRVKYNAQIVDPRYLLYALRTKEARTHIEEQATGTSDSMRNLSQPKLNTVPVPLAPLAEQKRIADKLDRLLAAVDTCKARLDAIPAILKRFRQSVLAAATSGELTADASEASAPWREMIFGDVLVELRNGLSPKPREEPPGTPILRISSVRPGGVDDSDIRYLEADDVDIERYKLRLGDLLFTRYNGTLEFVGVCAMYRNPSTNILLYPDKLIRARVDTQKVLPEFVELWFSAPAQRSAIEGFVRSSAGQKGIAGGDLKELPIRFPSLAEQQKIVSHVGSIFTSVAGAEAKAVASELRAGQLVQRLLARAFRGELSQM